VHILERLPEGPAMARALLDSNQGFQYLLGPHSEIKPDERTALAALVRLAGEKKDKPPAGPDHTSPQ